MQLGYARVSTFDQDLLLQRDALEGAGCERIFADTISGAKTNRPQLTAALDHLRAGDTLVVWRLNRLGRSLSELIDLMSRLNKEEIAFRCLTEQIDTTTSGGKVPFDIFGVLTRWDMSSRVCANSIRWTWVMSPGDTVGEFGSRIAGLRKLPW